MHFLITAGPTREALDPVRYLSNRSSGKMGYAMAQAAAAAGHGVTLISGPVALPAPENVRLVRVTSAQEMFDAVMTALPAAEVAVFAAAVADYRPVRVEEQKIKKHGDSLTLTLVRTPDILGSARASGFRGVLVGFAAETENLLANAEDKMRRKGCDLLVANDVSGTATGFDTDDNEITLLFAHGEKRALPRDSKSRLAEILVGVCRQLVVRSKASIMSETAAAAPDFLSVAIDAARQAGALIKTNYGSELGVNEVHQYDLKLEMDVRAQALITDILLAAFPTHAIYGEEGIAGDQSSEYQWIVDPIDGTVNYFYGIPHFCVSIALRKGQEIITGVIYDPMLDELFAAEKGGTPTLNGKPIRVSKRGDMADAMITVGFSKNKESIDAGLRRFGTLLTQVRKTRMLGSAALGMAYVAAGRLDAYIEEVISLWDVAAGILLVETAGGRAPLFPRDAKAEKYSMCASNGLLPLAEVEAEMAG